jgi:hypothetical protein
MSEKRKPPLHNEKGLDGAGAEIVVFIGLFPVIDKC